VRVGLGWCGLGFREGVSGIDKGFDRTTAVYLAGRHTRPRPSHPDQTHPSPAHRQQQESGEFGEAILRCFDSYQLVDSALAGLAVAPALRALVQRLYYDTLQRLDAGLRRCCAAFGPEVYSRLLEGYLLQGTAPVALAGKVVTAFKEGVHDAAVRVVSCLSLGLDLWLAGLRVLLGRFFCMELYASSSNPKSVATHPSLFNNRSGDPCSPPNARRPPTSCPAQRAAAASAAQPPPPQLPPACCWRAASKGWCGSCRRSTCVPVCSS